MHVSKTNRLSFYSVCFIERPLIYTQIHPLFNICIPIGKRMVQLSSNQDSVTQDGKYLQTLHLWKWGFMLCFLTKKKKCCSYKMPYVSKLHSRFYYSSYWFNILYPKTTQPNNSWSRTKYPAIRTIWNIKDKLNNLILYCILSFNYQDFHNWKNFIAMPYIPTI